MKRNILVAGILLIMSSFALANDVAFTLTVSPGYKDTNNGPFVPANYSQKVRCAITPAGGIQGAFATMNPPGPVAIDVTSFNFTITGLNGGDIVTCNIQATYKPTSESIISQNVSWTAPYMNSPGSWPTTVIMVLTGK